MSREVGIARLRHMVGAPDPEEAQQWAGPRATMYPQAGGQGTGPSPPGAQASASIITLTSQQGSRASDQNWTLKGPHKPSHPQAPGQARPGTASSLPIPRLLVHICSLFRSATRRPLPTHACQDSWAFVASPRTAAAAGGRRGWAGQGGGPAGA